MHLFRLFDYNGPARLSLNTCVYRRKYFLTVSQFDCWAQCTVLNDPDITQPLHFLFCITNAVFSANKSVFMFLSVIFTSEWCLHAKSSVIF